jgi:Fe-S-cluster containining protein
VVKVGRANKNTPASPADILNSRDAIEYVNYVRAQAGAALSARNLGKKYCQRCGFCCTHVTCVPRPDEISAIALFLGLNITELAKKYMVADKFGDTNYFLRWAKEGQEDITGIALPLERWFDRGYCILYDRQQRGCRIHSVKPQEAREGRCWDVAESDVYASPAPAAWHWEPPDIYRFLPDFKPANWPVQPLV